MPEKNCPGTSASRAWKGSARWKRTKDAGRRSGKSRTAAVIGAFESPSQAMSINWRRANKVSCSSLRLGHLHSLPQLTVSKKSSSSQSVVRKHFAKSRN